MSTKNAPNTLHVVGIGASAGGLDAIQQLFDSIPRDTGMAFVIIQHLSPDYKSLMRELLAKHTEMKISTAEDGVVLQPNCVYLNQSSKNLVLEKDRLRLYDKKPHTTLHLPIDTFFHSLGKSHGEHSIGIVLSGSGSDGSRGIRTIKEAGGTIIAQDPHSAQFDGMPNSSIGTGLVDYILPPREIAEVLTRYPTQHRGLESIDEPGQENEVAFQNILGEIHRSSGIDFRQYRRNTLLRRIQKRMAVTNVERMRDYQTLLSTTPAELRVLKQDFLIGVTRFFRDRDAFEALRQALPDMVESRGHTDTLRVWVPGCATGEEVYSIAILIEEYVRRNKPELDYKIFATDVDQRALDAASQGRFHMNAESELDREILESHFQYSEDSIQVRKRLRERIVFSLHNLIKDPPFIRMDLITCRNLLIYLEPETQRKVLLGFQFALNRGGLLFLGGSESLGDLEQYFEHVHRKWKIFRNVSEGKVIRVDTNPEERLRAYGGQGAAPPRVQPRTAHKENREAVYHRHLSRIFSPDCIFFDNNYDVLFLSGKAGERISLRSGMFEGNLLRMVGSDLATVIRNGVRQVRSTGKKTVVRDFEVEVDGQTSVFDLAFHYMKSSAEEDLFLVEFSRDRAPEPDALEIRSVPLDQVAKEQMEVLEQELAKSRQELQNVIEELETSNEELQSSNEELMASNEELQSTNEELQSVNEELYTVNSELQEKNKELELLSNDVNNLLDSTEIGTLFLDHDLRIRKFTPTLEKQFSLHPLDVGRPISSFASVFNDEVCALILKDCQRVIDTLEPSEKEILDKHGLHYFIKINPFVTTDKKIDGVVLSFVDISEVKRTESELKKARQRLENERHFATDVAHSAATGTYIYDIQAGRIEYLNNGFTDLLGYTLQDLEAMAPSQFQALVHPEDQDAVFAHVAKIADGEQEEIDYRIRHRNGQWIRCRSKDSPFEYGENNDVRRYIGTLVVLENTQA